MTITKHETFGYELTDEGKLNFFGHAFDDFESYIESYWNKTQSEECDGSYDKAFMIDYIDNQFEADFDIEIDRRNELENEGNDDDVCFYDIGHVNWFEVKNTPENLEKIKKEDDSGYIYDYYIFDDEGDDDSVIHVETLAEWSWMYFTRKVYSDLIKENFCVNVDIKIEDVQKEDISVNG